MGDNMIMDQLKRNPLMYIVVSVISTAVFFLMSTSIATTTQVKEAKFEMKEYANNKHKDVKEDLDKIDKKLDRIEGMILKLYRDKK